MNQATHADQDNLTLQIEQDVSQLSPNQIKSELINERQRCVVLEKDLFKYQAEKRRLEQQIKTLQEINTLNAKNRNNTSSAFTLPSEFKSAWDELVKELILDAFPDFLDKYEELEYSLKIFSLSDEQIDNFINVKYKPRCELILQSKGDDAISDLEDNIGSQDFKRFIRAVLKLTLHMTLNDPPILMGMEVFEDRTKKEVLTDKFEFWMYNKNDYYCIDGFPKEGYPCVVVLPPPYRAGYVYQGIKPAVIVLTDPSDELMEHVRIKQEELVEKLKAKRQLSLCGREEQEQRESKQEEMFPQQPQINIINVKASSQEGVEINDEDNSLERTIEKLRQSINEDAIIQSTLLKTTKTTPKQQTSQKKSSKKKSTTSKQSIKKEKSKSPIKQYESPIKQEQSALRQKRTTQPQPISSNKKSNTKQQKEEERSHNSTPLQSNSESQLSQTYKQLQLQNEQYNKENAKNNNLQEKRLRDSFLKQQSERQIDEENLSNYTKSPTQLKEKLQNTYKEMLSMNIQKLSASQYLNKQILEKREEILQSEEALSARRRMSNNYVNSNTNVKHKYVPEKASRNSITNVNSLIGSQSQQVIESDSQNRQQFNDTQSYKSSIQSQIRKLAETMRGQTGQKSSTNEQQVEYQQKTSLLQQQPINSTIKPTTSYGYRDATKCYEMPKKVQSDSQKRLALQKQTNQSMLNTSNNNSSSIVAAMHYQNGMSSIKQDLQRKIHNYQSILKKSYVDKVNKNQSLLHKNLQQPKSPFEYSKFVTLDNQQQSNQQKYSHDTTQSHLQDKTNQSSRNILQNKIENLQSLKASFFQKIQTLTKQIEQEKTSVQQQRLTSRSKSPLQQNMPRQYPYDKQKLMSNGLASQMKKYDDLSSSDSEDLNLRQDEQTTKNRYGREMTNSVKEFKRVRKQEVNFKSLTRADESLKGDYTPNSKRMVDQTSTISSPKPCVSYRGQQVGINGTSRGLLSSSLAYTSALQEKMLTKNLVKRATQVRSFATIQSIKAREILDSRGNPTVEADVIVNDGSVFRAAVPSGASTGIYEALELRDKDLKRFLGKGCTKAVQNIATVIAPALKGSDVTQQSQIDKKMVEELDGTKNEFGWAKQKLGANAILAVSLAVARAGAATKKIPLYQHLAELAGTKKDSFVMPVPSLNIINGGAHAGNTLEVQEFMILPTGAQSFKESLRLGVETYHQLSKLLKQKYGKSAANVGDEGGFGAPQIKDENEALELIMEAISKAGHQGKIDIGLDVAASEFYVKEGNLYDFSHKSGKGDRRYTSDQLIDLYDKLVKKFPIKTIEDPFDQDDFDSYKRMTKKLGQNLQIVGDDLLVTNPRRVQTGIDEKLCNALLLKVNQIGTVTESIEASNMSRKAGWGVMVSHRSGETEDSFIADLVVGLGTGQIKSGAPCRSDRLAKYNQLLRIEEELGSKAVFAGKNFRNPSKM